MVANTSSRRRRSKAEIKKVWQAISDLLNEDHPMTVRQVFYRLVSEGRIAKTEAEYKSTVVRQLGVMRRAGEIPFDWIADHTRWMRKPRSYSSLSAALQLTAETYRRALWDNQEVYVELWLEKDALAGVLMEETGPWDVPLMVTRGYPSLSYVYEAAETISVHGKPTFLYYCGDWDPSGLDIPRSIETNLREFAPDAEIHFQRIAVTQEQIIEWALPTRPTKKTDSRSRGFEGESVEVDAIPPRSLRDLVKRYITQHIDQRQLEILKAAERSERELLQKLPQQLQSIRKRA